MNRAGRPHVERAHDETDGTDGRAITVCDDRRVSSRAVLHILNASWRLSGGAANVGVPVARLDEAMAAGGDMWTPLNLESLEADGRAVRLPDGTSR